MKASTMNATVVATSIPSLPANPFLRSYSIADLRNWAERKMSGARAAAGDSGAVIVTDPPISPEVRAFIAAIDQIRHAI